MKAGARASLIWWCKARRIAPEEDDVRRPSDQWATSNERKLILSSLHLHGVGRWGIRTLLIKLRIHKKTSAVIRELECISGHKGKKRSINVFVFFFLIWMTSWKSYLMKMNLFVKYRKNEGGKRLKSMSQEFSKLLLWSQSMMSYYNTRNLENDDW